MHKHTYKERETEIYEVRQDFYVFRIEEGDLYLIYTRLQEDLQLVLSRAHFFTILIKWVTSSIYREEKKLPNS